MKDVILRIFMRFNRFNPHNEHKSALFADHIHSSSISLTTGL
jgi:hypothetical protein